MIYIPYDIYIYIYLLSQHLLGTHPVGTLFSIPTKSGVDSRVRGMGLTRNPFSPGSKVLHTLLYLCTHPGTTVFLKLILTSNEKDKKWSES